MSAFLSYWKSQITDAGEQAGVSNSGSGASNIAPTPRIPDPAQGCRPRTPAGGGHRDRGRDSCCWYSACRLWCWWACSWRGGLPGASGCSTGSSACGSARQLRRRLPGVVVRHHPNAEGVAQANSDCTVMIAFLYLLLLGMAKDRWNDRAGQRVGSPRRRALIAVSWGVISVLAFLCILPGVTTANRQISGALKSRPRRGRQHRLHQQLAAAADQLSSEGNKLYGNGWWSAPVVEVFTPASHSAIC